MVGHDIRNPLQAIISEIYLAEIESKTMPDGKAKEAIHQSFVFIEEQIDYINKIVSDLQDYAKQVKPELKEINVTEAIEGSLATVSFPREIQVYVHVNRQLRHLCLDSLLLKRVIVNLVTNSVQAMPKGGKLTIKAFTEANKARITFEDTGWVSQTRLNLKFSSP
jgi:signal transduction histidine kinase